MNKLHNIANNYYKSIVASLLITIVAYCNLLCENRYIGAFMFSFGLIVICKYNLNLFTGQAGYITIKQIPNYLITIITNLFYTMFFSVLLSFNENACLKAREIWATKSNLGVDSLIFSSFFCGVLIYIGVDYYKKHSSIVGLLFAIPIFVLCGFDHAVADTVYFTLAFSKYYVGDLFTTDLIRFLIIILFNIAGSKATKILIENNENNFVCWDNTRKE